ncbi:hypothetical protein CSIM01_12216 [Colletotrichum simmondsii]|uniref:SET domain-containing protein n=1 Tax=Colletotrichum simmondsii TaxID=703756 RepID=A0A135RXN0_9PEZI|nr:hypothetical protein CSIM01_12216 [Colletotrichum simmondsii]
MDSIKPFPFRVIHHQRQGMARDDYFVGFQVCKKFHIDTHGLAFLDLAVEDELANDILSLSKPLEEIKAEFLDTGFGKLESPILLQPAELPLLTSYKNGHDIKERLTIFSNEFFEIRKSPTAGWGAFASKKLYQGDQILVEKALYHAIYADVTTSVRSLPEKERLIANDMFGHKGRDGETHEEAVWNTNAFAAYVPSKSGYKRNMPGLFAVAGRFNHSCLPKIDYKYRASHESLVFTVRDWVIEEGQELTISYGQDPSVLYYKYGFICECGHCRRFDPRKSEWS